jgi:hypothetical protein
MESWEIFDKSIENLTTLLIYYVHHQKFIINPEFGDEKIIEILKAFINQHEKFYFLMIFPLFFQFFSRFLTKNPETPLEETNGRIPLSVLLVKVFDKMDFMDIIVTFFIFPFFILEKTQRKPLKFLAKMKAIMFPNSLKNTRL